MSKAKNMLNMLPLELETLQPCLFNSIDGQMKYADVELFLFKYNSIVVTVTKHNAFSRRQLQIITLKQYFQLHIL